MLSQNTVAYSELRASRLCAVWKWIHSYCIQFQCGSVVYKIYILYIMQQIYCLCNKYIVFVLLVDSRPDWRLFIFWHRIYGSIQKDCNFKTLSIKAALSEANKRYGRRDTDYLFAPNCSGGELCEQWNHKAPCTRELTCTHTLKLSHLT